MAYDLAKISMTALLEPAFRAGVELARLDERIARSAVGQGFLERSQFTDACASLWIDGELVHLEDLVLHDATRDIRTPTHELTIARDVLRTRRRISGQSPDWSLSADGVRALRQTSDITSAAAGEAEPAGVIRREAPIDAEGEGEDVDNVENLPGVDYAAIDAVLYQVGFGWLPEERIGPQLQQGVLKALPLGHGARRATPLHLIVKRDLTPIDEQVATLLDLFRAP